MAENGSAPAEPASLEEAVFLESSPASERPVFAKTSKVTTAAVYWR
jgi:hypothetical protein